MTAVAGIDFSSFAIDVVLLDEDTDDAEHHRIVLPKKADALTRARAVRDLMPPRTRWHDQAVAIGIEKPFSRNGRGGDTMAIVLGAIIASLPADLPLHLIRADDWRRACELKIRQPRADHKRAAIDFAGDRWADHPMPLTSDCADAYCIAHATRILAAPQEAAAA